MTQPEQSSFLQVCPYLGLADDADSHATYSTEAHRCYKLPTPTRIAVGHQETYCLGENHVACPVFRGEGIPGRPAGAAAGATAATAATAPRPAEPRLEGDAPAVTAGRPRPAPRRAAARPLARPGGISMPVATIGMFALAVVVIALAFVITNIASDDNGDLTPSERFQTAQAQSTQVTLTAGTRTATTGTPGTPTTATGSPTPGTTTPAPGRTYTVRSGDTCSGIASGNATTVDELKRVNNFSDQDCLALQPGQVIRLP